MTLSELQRALANRKARLYIDLHQVPFSRPVWDVTIAHVSHQNRVARATADQLEDAFAAALLRYDMWGGS